jgi:hypothetical protein
VYNSKPNKQLNKKEKQPPFKLKNKAILLSNVKTTN